MLDTNYKIRYSRHIAHIYEFELIRGALEILLRGNFGRFTPSPLIRSALEILISRNVLDTKKSIKYKNKKFKYSQDFRFGNLLKAIKKTGSEISIGLESAERIFNWGSISVHRAYRMTHSDMWYALLVTNSIGDSVIKIQNNKNLGKITDEIFDELLKNNELELTP